jgi:hypothetical protein
MRARVIKPAIQDQPAKFSNLTINGTATFNSTVILDGTVTGSAVPSISPYQSLVANSILPYQGSNNIVSTVKNSVIGGGRFNDISAGSDYGGIIGGEFNLLQHARSFILGANITSSAANTVFANSMSLDGTLSIPGFSDVSASLAAAGGGGGSTPTLQQVTDQGSSTTTPITASIISASNTITSISASIDRVLVNDTLQGNGSGFQFFAFNEDTVKVKFANWYSSNDRQYGMGQLWFETWFAAIDDQADRDNRRIGFYLETPNSGSTDSTSGVTGTHPTNARFYVDITGSYIASGGLHVTDANFDVESDGNVSVNGTLDMNSNDINNVNDMTITGAISASGEITTNGFTNVGSTSLTLSSSFTTTLNFSTNRIMSVTTGSALSMSIDTGNSILGNVIMTDISSSVGLHLTGSEFKVLNGTFDTTKRNYVYYHYIGNDTALVTINQES